MNRAIAKRQIQALAATLVSVALALLSLSLLVAVALTFTPLSALAESRFVLVGLPLGVFALVLTLLLRRARASVMTYVSCAAIGLLALCWLGGAVLMQTACSIHSGGC